MIVFDFVLFFFDLSIEQRIWLFCVVHARLRLLCVYCVLGIVRSWNIFPPTSVGRRTILGIWSFPFLVLPHSLTLLHSLFFCYFPFLLFSLCCVIYFPTTKTKSFPFINFLLLFVFTFFVFVKKIIKHYTYTHTQKFISYRFLPLWPQEFCRPPLPPVERTFEFRLKSNKELKDKKLDVSI